MAFDPIGYINTPRWQKVSLGLERTRWLLDELGCPDRSLRFVHVAGTNGKGSTCACLASICCAAGLRTGLFTSPYIERFEERIRVNGADIPSDDLLAHTLAVKRAAEAVERASGEHPTEFELMCAVALLHFAQMGCDICIMEVGLGGRLDSTNVIQPDVCAITRIGYDHTALLGDTLSQIAREKAGIIKPDVPCITCTQPADALRAIEDACARAKSPLIITDPADITGSRIASDMTRAFTYQGEAFSTRLLGAYQPENAAIAIECARTLRSLGWPIGEEAVHAGIARATWTGRFEVLGRDPLIIVDGAHNPDGAAALAASLDELFHDGAHGQRYGVVGVLADKDATAIISPHLSTLDRFYLYEPDNPRALPAADLDALIKDLDADAEVRTFRAAEDAMRAARDEAAPEDSIIAFGSLYSIAAVRSAARAS